MNIDQKQFSDQLAQLIATPSISCTNPTLDMGNRQVIDLLANWLDDYGFKIDIQVVDEQANKANLIATLEPQKSTSISGTSLRSRLMNRSNNKSVDVGSTEVIPKQ